MKTERDGQRTTIVLSRRNLLVLLAKLDGHPIDSACEIKGGWEAQNITIRAEEDDVHYAHRPPGPMHPDTEAFL